MTSAPIRDPIADHLLTPENSAHPKLADRLNDDKPLDRTTLKSREDTGSW